MVRRLPQLRSHGVEVHPDQWWRLRHCPAIMAASMSPVVAYSAVAIGSGAGHSFGAEPSMTTRSACMPASSLPTRSSRPRARAPSTVAQDSLPARSWHSAALVRRGDDSALGGGTEVGDRDVRSGQLRAADRHAEREQRVGGGRAVEEPVDLVHGVGQAGGGVRGAVQEGAAAAGRARAVDRPRRCGRA